MADEGLAHATIKHVRDDLGGIFKTLWKAEEIPSNPIERSEIPKKAKKDKRRRVSPTDEEFAAFMACTEVPEQLRLMALISRAFGGLRTSDIHAWNWEHIDQDTWAHAEVHRPKTEEHDEGTVRQVIPEIPTSRE